MITNTYIGGGGGGRRQEEENILFFPDTLSLFLEKNVWIWSAVVFFGFLIGLRRERERGSKCNCVDTRKRFIDKIFFIDNSEEDFLAVVISDFFLLSSNIGWENWEIIQENTKWVFINFYFQFSSIQKWLRVWKSQKFLKISPMSFSKNNPLNEHSHDLFFGHCTHTWHRKPPSACRHNLQTIPKWN